ncbi:MULTISPECIES: DUF2269 family protein [Pseudomonas]|jgi:uncharacterized membrane protein|uniref:DUF2269 domain-containing protein n=1 Tax=Pseudomonas fluorescens TaxID=294 RepID=A0A5E7L878_PSEFL|nr:MULTISPECIES: DUF2269 family protein [Pseudomonas]KQT68306.1 hypothetical protein ASG55_10610 [Pseudomonas sp. Leaf434]MDR7053090.1 putative membrane protein [Pseudomonas koreensis]TDK56797.1 DUF2269 family protein [Pseudomonas moraviensis]VVP08373.1 hypothetical protein PS847_03195 [Pseudomonas fluorescens]
METLTTLKVLHVAATVVILASGLGLAALTWRNRSEGPASTMRRPWLFIWCLMLIGMLSMPFTGWWLVHLVGWPLGQLWILGSSVIYAVATFSAVWLLVRLDRLWTSGVGNRTFNLALAIVSGVGFVAIAALMGAKPV